MKKFLLLFFVLLILIGMMGCASYIEKDPDELHSNIQGEDRRAYPAHHQSLTSDC